MMSHTVQQQTTKRLQNDVVDFCWILPFFVLIFKVVGFIWGQKRFKYLKLNKKVWSYLLLSCIFFFALKLFFLWSLFLGCSKRRRRGDVVNCDVSILGGRWSGREVRELLCSCSYVNLSTDWRPAKTDHTRIIIWHHEEKRRYYPSQYLKTKK